MTFPAYSAYKDSGVEWLGKTPKHWKVVNAKRGISVLTDFTANGSFASLAENVEYQSSGYARLIRMTDLRQNLETEGIWVDEKAYKYLEKSSLAGGELLMASVGSVGLIYLMPEVDYRASLAPNMYLLKTNSSLLSKFLFWTLLSDGGQSQILQVATTTAQPKLNKDNVRSIVIALPEIQEQIQIVRFLDHETARIDALIEEQQRLIELLKEKRQAVISHAVTKGLDPTVPMKDSGEEWLGEVPAHWEVKQLKHVVDPNTSITYGIVQAGPEFEGGIPYIRTSDMSGEELPISGYPLTSPEIDESYARSRVRPGDIVMSIRASVGKCLPVPDELKIANLTQGTAKISAGKGITRNFLLEFLNAEATQNYFDLMAKGATFKEITLDALRRTPALLPPASEQIKIEQFVAKHAGLLDEVCKQAIESVSLLQERRSALISAAVTGKIDVRGWQPSASAPTPELAQEAV